MGKWAEGQALAGWESPDQRGTECLTKRGPAPAVVGTWFGRRDRIPVLSGFLNLTFGRDHLRPRREDDHVRSGGDRSRMCRAQVRQALSVSVVSAALWRYSSRANRRPVRSDVIMEVPPTRPGLVRRLVNARFCYRIVSPPISRRFYRTWGVSLQQSNSRFGCIPRKQRRSRSRLP